jgi:hypothetical protein
MEFYAAMKKNEMLSFTGKWMELKNIILSEVSLAQKTKNHVCLFNSLCDQKTEETNDEVWVIDVSVQCVEGTG